MSDCGRARSACTRTYSRVRPQLLETTFARTWVAEVFIANSRPTSTVPCSRIAATSGSSPSGCEEHLIISSFHGLLAGALGHFQWPLRCLVWAAELWLRLAAATGCVFRCPLPRTCGVGVSCPLPSATFCYNAYMSQTVSYGQLRRTYCSV